MARLPDPTGRLSGDGRAIYERMLARRQSQCTGLYGPYTALLHHPRLAEGIERLGYYYKFESTLPRDVYQFVVLAFAKRTGIEFEWLDHLDHARRAGLPEEVIDALAAGDGQLPEPYRSVRECMDVVLRYQSIPESLQAEVVRLVGVEGLLEIVTLCGFYGLIGMVSTSFDVPLPSAARGRA